MASRTTTDPIEKILVDLGVDLTSLAFEDSSEQDYLSKLREGLATIEFKSKGDYLKNPESKEQYRILQEEFEENLSKNSNNLSETIKNFSVENSKCMNRADERKRNRFQLSMLESKIFEFGQLKPI